MMRHILLALLLFVPIGSASASSICGIQPSITDKSLEGVIGNAAKRLVASKAEGEDLRKAAMQDLEELKRLAGGVGASQVGAYYFHVACLEFLGIVSQDAKSKTEVHDKLKIISEVFGQTSETKDVLQRLAVSEPAEAPQSEVGATKPFEVEKAKQEAEQARQEAAQQQRQAQARAEEQARKEVEAQRMEAAREAERSAEPIEKPAPAPQASEGKKENIITKKAEAKSEPPSSGQAGVDPDDRPKVAVSPPAATANGKKTDIETTKKAIGARDGAKRAFKSRGFKAPDSEKSAAGFAATDTKSECEQLGQIGGGDCTDFEKIIENLKEVPLAYNHPKSMYLGKRTQITLALKTSRDDHKKELEGLPGEVKTGQTKISRIMQAELSGAAFKIEPSGAQQRTVTSLSSVKWTWFVTPLEEGTDKVLNLEVSAILREGTKALPPVTIRTFRTQIEVDVRWWDLVLYKIQAFDPVYQLATAIGGIASALLLIWRFATWRRRRRSKGEAGEVETDKTATT